jgi:hypothetical protein
MNARRRQLRRHARRGNRRLGDNQSGSCGDKAAPAGAVLAAVRAMLADLPDTPSAAVVAPPQAEWSNGGIVESPPRPRRRRPSCHGHRRDLALPRTRIAPRGIASAML